MPFKNSISGVVLTTVLIQQPDTGSHPLPVHGFGGVVLEPEDQEDVVPAP
jgi:hypothetical protein